MNFEWSHTKLLKIFLKREKTIFKNLSWNKFESENLISLKATLNKMVESLLTGLFYEVILSYFKLLVPKLIFIINVQPQLIQKISGNSENLRKIQSQK